MMQPWSATQRRIAALTLLVTVLILLYWVFIGSWFVQPLSDMATQRAQLVQEQLQYQTRLDNETTVLKHLQQERASHPQQRSLLQGGDPSLVAASLMSRINAVVEKSSHGKSECEVTQATPITTDIHPEAPYLAISASLTLKCRIKPLIAIMHDIESDQPWLFIEHVSIGRAENAPSKGGPGKLDVQLLIEGYMHRPATVQAAS